MYLLKLTINEDDKPTRYEYVGKQKFHLTKNHDGIVDEGYYSYPALLKKYGFKTMGKALLSRDEWLENFKVTNCDVINIGRF